MRSILIERRDSIVGCGELANRINRERCASYLSASYELLAVLKAVGMKLSVEPGNHAVA